ncbi:MAG: protein-glutamate O-methyltransferase CheR [Candidatus Magnetoovum sp. WYHC-5]|nr:protein-glutamate O-methyltransferase CheR [Candidatus Magnetoovum sp. WYHC-5]
MTALDKNTFKAFRDFIYEKSGIFIPDTKKYFIENRLSKRIEEKKIASFEDYLYLLKYDTTGNELNALFDRITTNETFFFREIKQLEVFVNVLAPKILSTKRTASFKIWSAACSTGEEPYTLLIMLMENVKTNSIKMDMIASDISDSVLLKAKTARYGQYAMRNVPERYKKRYFSENGKNEYTLNASMKRMVRFIQVNLLDDKKVRLIRDCDAIFCRNVLIYFDKHAKMKVVNSLYDCLNPGGYLIIGMAESLHDITKAFRPNIMDGTVIYQKT